MNKEAFNKIQLTPEQREANKWAIVRFERELSKLEITETGGFFSQDSMTWKIYREPVMLIGGLSALFLQISHPAIAEGVRQFSNFHEEYLYRAHRTFLSMASFYFGSAATAKKTARRLFGMHSMIRGTVDIKENGTRKKYDFCAKDPQLLTWVLATLIETSLRLTEEIKGNIPLKDKMQFFEESKIIATLMGIPLDRYPKNYTDFKLYYQSMLEGETLEMNPTNMSISQKVLQPPFFSHRYFKAMAGYFLPDKIANAYQIPPNRFDQRIIKWSIRLLKFNARYCPKFIKYAPPYYQALYRMKKHKTYIHLGYFYNFITKNWKFPFGLQET